MCRLGPSRSGCSATNEALRLLQQIRDEAHRFGQHYHHILRRKATFEAEVQEGRRPPRSARSADPTAKKRRRKKGEVVIEPDDSQLPPDDT